MLSRYQKLTAQITLFFFTSMVCYSPVYAQSFKYSGNTSIDPVLISGKNIPVTYVTPAQAEEIFRLIRQKGYEIREGTVQQLAELTDNGQEIKPTTNIENPDKKLPDCEESSKTSKEDECAKKEQTTDTEQQADKPMPVEFPESSASPQPLPPPVEPLPPQPVPEPTVHTNVGIYADVSYGSGRGSHGDAGKVFFIVAGIMVMAAFIVYAGKYISDLITGKDVKVWWEFIFSNTYLSTGSGEHGRLNGLKIGTGFVSSDLIQVALIGEFGNSDIDLILNEDSNSTALDFSATYWLLGATARLHLSDKLVNASYLYLDFMGGKTSNGATDTIGMARLGASFGVNDYLRLGASFGAFYLGLDDDQGFANNDDNYWTTFGFEIGAKF